MSSIDIAPALAPLPSSEVENVVDKPDDDDDHSSEVEYVIDDPDVGVKIKCDHCIHCNGLDHFVCCNSDQGYLSFFHYDCLGKFLEVHPLGNDADRKGDELKGSYGIGDALAMMYTGPLQEKTFLKVFPPDYRFAFDNTYILDNLVFKTSVIKFFGFLFRNGYKHDESNTEIVRIREFMKKNGWGGLSDHSPKYAPAEELNDDDDEDDNDDDNDKKSKKAKIDKEEQ